MIQIFKSPLCIWAHSPKTLFIIPNPRRVYGHNTRASNWRTAAAGWDTNQGLEFVAGPKYMTSPILVATPPSSWTFIGFHRFALNFIIFYPFSPFCLDVHTFHINYHRFVSISLDFHDCSYLPKCAGQEGNLWALNLVYRNRELCPHMAGRRAIYEHWIWSVGIGNLAAKHLYRYIYIYV